MNIFQRLVHRDTDQTTTLGNPISDPAMRDARMHHFAAMRRGNGFKQPSKDSKSPQTNADGTTRGDRKRKARALANAKVSEDRPEIYMHSHAVRMRRIAEALRGAK